MPTRTSQFSAYRGLLFPTSPRHRGFVHVLFWTCFILYHLLFFVPAWTQQRPSSELLWAYGLYYARFIPLYYLLVVVYRLGPKPLGSVAWLGATLAVGLVAMHLITTLLYQSYALLWGLENLPPIFESIGQRYLKPWSQRAGGDWLVFIYDLVDFQLLILPIGLHMMKHGLLRELEQIRWQEEKAKTELKALRSLLTPHFIFNIFNATATELDSVSGPGAAYLHQAADLIRFTLYEAEKAFIPLEEEHHLIQQYLELESMRAELRTEIAFTHTGPVQPRHRVPTLLLLTLVENAFKHSVHATYLPSFVDITSRVEKDWLHFTVTNSVPPPDSGPAPAGSGLGLSTIRSTLELKFPGEHQFEISHEEAVFTVHISLPLDRYPTEEIGAEPDNGHA
ncbi:hypothetical protein HNQ92_001099 [Rhabdobacter roseus]|uniref:Signal transduction histidine kinase internal region domain-containing protein n=1 Tax=Rhabdobacter roseus TaxID=1655419 RepID=A0A840TP28_9BACT|nr:histidine kinase [Rhabdobacter roseus]MBB5282973.1 hypothetical protein [Rhabdobacter roseus]